MNFKQNIIFRNASITKQEYEYLVRLVEANNFQNILEFGPGVSTYAFLENKCNIWSLEDIPYWFEINSKRFDGNDLVKLFLYNKDKDIDIKDIDNIKFDMAFVDGPCGSKSFSRILSCNYASKRTNIFLLHDCNRQAEKDTLEIFSKEGWKIKIIEKGKKNGICYKDNSIIFP